MSMNSTRHMGMTIMTLHYHTMLGQLKGKEFEAEAQVQIDLAEMMEGSAYQAENDWALLGDFVAQVIMLSYAFPDAAKTLFNDVYPGVEVRSFKGMRQLLLLAHELNGWPQFVIAGEGDERSVQNAREDQSFVTPLEILTLVEETMDHHHRQVFPAPGHSLI